MLLRFDWGDVDKLHHLEVARVANDAFLRKAHDPCRDGEERIVRSLPDIEPWTDLGTALTDENVARFCVLTSVLFDTKALTVRITAVLCRTLGHFCCHISIEIYQDVQDRMKSEALASTGVRRTQTYAVEEQSQQRSYSPILDVLLRVNPHPRKINSLQWEWRQCS